MKAPSLHYGFYKIPQFLCLSHYANGFQRFSELSNHCSPQWLYTWSWLPIAHWFLPSTSVTCIRGILWCIMLVCCGTYAILPCLPSVPNAFKGAFFTEEAGQQNITFPRLPCTQSSRCYLGPTFRYTCLSVESVIKLSRETGNNP